ncbi:MAG: DNA alkylation repair protein [Legionellales bacterium]|nr:DNA alkylation repair protein [Legionellales bacterium]
MLQKEFRKLACKKTAEHSQRFFKTAKGEYGYGDVFLGIRVPVIRKFAKDHHDLPITLIKNLIKSPYHEERLLGLIILINKYDLSKSITEKQNFYKLYINHFKYINNWDLVDVTCPYIVGKHLIDKDRAVLYSWAKSEHLWTRRIAIVTNLWFIRKSDLQDIFKISKILLNDKHDLIHKAVGWMLRESWKKNAQLAESFLIKHYKKMPRTMLRYAIEKFSENKRQKYLKGEI